MTPDDDDTVETLPLVRAESIRVADWGAHSSTGLRRPNNEDAWGATDDRIFAVADGMGGTEGGEKASAMAIAEFMAIAPSAGWLQSVRRISDRLRVACAAAGVPHAGTTLVGLIVESSRCVTVNVGDSRIYRLRGQELELLTTDHNLGNLRITEGLPATGPDERGGPRALTSYLGSPDSEQRVDVSTIAIEDGDVVLLCSDGVSGQIDEASMSAALASETCKEAAMRLVSEANACGGRDNSTALVVRFERRSS